MNVSSRSENLVKLWVILSVVSSSASFFVVAFVGAAFVRQFILIREPMDRFLREMITEETLMEAMKIQQSLLWLKN